MGRPKGSKNKKTLEKEKQLAELAAIDVTAPPTTTTATVSEAK